MATIVVPFRSGGKSRLPAERRVEVALAMLRGVLEAGAAFSADVRLVTDDALARVIAAELGVEVVADPGGGQAAAVGAGLAAAEGVCLVVNADLPSVQPADLEALAAPARAGALALAAAADGTTNALGLPFAAAFQPLYGPGSAARFRAHAAALGLDVHDLELPGLCDDVDTVADLEQATLRA